MLSIMTGIATQAKELVSPCELAVCEYTIYDAIPCNKVSQWVSGY